MALTRNVDHIGKTAVQQELCVTRQFNQVAHHHRRLDPPLARAPSLQSPLPENRVPGNKSHTGVRVVWREVTWPVSVLP